MDTPVTVLMAVHNGSPYLRTATESILNQTYRNFRFLIVDDGSSDDSREILRSYDDERVEVLPLGRNVGQTAALNIGLRHASTPWIARMDADDYSAPTRLEEQMKALEADRSLSCVGTFCWVFRTDPSCIDSTIVHPVHWEDVKCWSLTGCPMTHGTIVVNRAAMLDVGAYNERYKVAADIELYERLLKRYRATNVPRILYGCRVHPGQGQWSRLSLEETIEILTRRLVDNELTRREAALVRAALSGRVLTRVECLWNEQKYWGCLAGLSRALRLSPRSVVRWSLRSLLGPLLRPTIHRIWGRGLRR